MIIDRRTFARSAAGLMTAAGITPLSPLFAGTISANVDNRDTLDPVETMVRLRSRTDGKLSISWLDASRETMIEGEIQPFCRLLSYVLTKFHRDGETYAAKTFEFAYYCDPKTGELLDTVVMPGASEPVMVPIYRAGPTLVRFRQAFDEWEEYHPDDLGAASAKFAPPSWVHLVRGVHQPGVIDDDIYVRADEYGRAYADRSKPPSVYYREWIVWKGSAHAIFETDSPDVASDFSYGAASSFRPWMKMEGVDGHTIENGRGAKVASIAALPPLLTGLLEKHDPKALDNPESLFT